MIGKYTPAHSVLDKCRAATIQNCYAHPVTMAQWYQGEVFSSFGPSILSIIAIFSVGMNVFTRTYKHEIQKTSSIFMEWIVSVGPMIHRPFQNMLKPA